MIFCLIYFYVVPRSASPLLLNFGGAVETGVEEQQKENIRHCMIVEVPYGNGRHGLIFGLNRHYEGQVCFSCCNITISSVWTTLNGTTETKPPTCHSI